MAADFFTTEVWTVRGLVTYYTVFVIQLHSRRVSIVGSTPHPDEAFMLQIGRQLTDASDGVLNGRRFLIRRNATKTDVIGEKRTRGRQQAAERRF